MLTWWRQGLLARVERATRRRRKLFPAAVCVFFCCDPFSADVVDNEEAMGGETMGNEDNGGNGQMENVKWRKEMPCPAVPTHCTTRFLGGATNPPPMPPLFRKAWHSFFKGAARQVVLFFF